MADKFKFEIIILVCSCLTGVICSELISVEKLSITSLLGGVALMAILLFAMALFTITSIHGIPEDKKIRKKVRTFYIQMGIVSLVAMLLLIVFKAEPITFWVISCILWYLLSSIRIAVLWDWF